MSEIDNRAATFAAILQASERDRALRDSIILELRAQGQSLQAIAQVVGLSHQTVKNILDRG